MNINFDLIRRQNLAINLVYSDHHLTNINWRPATKSPCLSSWDKLWKKSRIEALCFFYISLDRFRLLQSRLIGSMRQFLPLDSERDSIFTLIAAVHLLFLFVFSPTYGNHTGSFFICQCEVKIWDPMLKSHTHEIEME